MATNTLVEAYSDTYTLSQLQAIRLACLQVHQRGGTTTVHLEGQTMDIDSTRAGEILSIVQEAIALKQADEADEIRDLTRPAVAMGLDWRNLRIH